MPAPALSSPHPARTEGAGKGRSLRGPQGEGAPGAMSPLSTRGRAWPRRVAAGAPHHQQALTAGAVGGHSCIPRGLPAQPLARRAAQAGALGPPSAPMRPPARAPPLQTTPTRGGEGRGGEAGCSPNWLPDAAAAGPGAPGEALSRWRQGPPCRPTVLCPRPDVSASPVSESPCERNDLRGTLILLVPGGPFR